MLVSRHVIPRLLRRLFIPQDSASSSSLSSSGCSQSSQFVPTSPYAWSSLAGSPSGDKKNRHLEEYEAASHSSKKSVGGFVKGSKTIEEGGTRKSQPLLDSFDAVAAVEVAPSHYRNDNDNSYHVTNKSKSSNNGGGGRDVSESSEDDGDNDSDRPLSPDSTLLLDRLSGSNDVASSTSSGSSGTSGFSRRGSSGPHNSSSSSSSSSGSTSHTLRAPPELLTLLVVVYCLSMALLSEYMNLSYSSGALVAGLLWQGNLPDGLGLQAHVSCGLRIFCADAATRPINIDRHDLQLLCIPRLFIFAILLSHVQLLI